MSAKAKLQQLRELATSQRKSDEVIRLGTELLTKYDGGLLVASQLGDEAWTVREFIFIACLDDLDEYEAQAAKLLKQLQDQFGTKSLRVLRLKGMLHEAKGEFDEAAKLYSAILAEEPGFIPAIKRQVAILKAQGKIAKAIELLAAYLDTYMNDVEGWQELAELYLSRLMYPQAQFCMEELVLLEPHNSSRHLKLASVLYTQGGVENLLLAKKYYCKVIDLTKSDLRAFWGLKMCCKALSESGCKKAELEKARVAELDKFASEGIKRLQGSSPTVDVVTSALDSLALKTSS